MSNTAMHESYLAGLLHRNGCMVRANALLKLEAMFGELTAAEMDEREQEILEEAKKL